jgi:hypothetical protein
MTNEEEAMSVVVDDLNDVGVEGLTAELRWIDPDEARRLIGQNEANRHVKPPRVTQFAGALARGEVGVSWDAIAIAANGRLLNGQHRLHGVVAAGCGAWFVVLEGLPPRAMEWGDAGAPRTTADTLYISGEKNANQLGSALKVLFEFERSGRVWNAGMLVPPTRGELLATLDRHPTIRDFAGWKRPTALKALSPAPWRTFMYIATGVNPDDAAAFREGVELGSTLSPGDARLTLRTRLLAESAKTSSALRPFVAMVFVIKAWNAWRAGEPMLKLNFKSGGAAPESYPQIDGIQYVDGRPVMLQTED